jgi:hypothetical protein
MIIQCRQFGVEFAHFPDELFDLLFSESRRHHTTESLELRQRYWMANRGDRRR